MAKNLVHHDPLQRIKAKERRLLISKMRVKIYHSFAKYFKVKKRMKKQLKWLNRQGTQLHKELTFMRAEFEIKKFKRGEKKEYRILINDLRNEIIENDPAIIWKEQLNEWMGQCPHCLKIAEILRINWDLPRDVDYLRSHIKRYINEARNHLIAEEETFLLYFIDPENSPDYVKINHPNEQIKNHCAQLPMILRKRLYSQKGKLIQNLKALDRDMNEEALGEIEEQMRILIEMVGEVVTSRQGFIIAAVDQYIQEVAKNKSR